MMLKSLPSWMVSRCGAEGGGAGGERSVRGAEGLRSALVLGGAWTMGNADVLYRRMATGVVLFFSLTLGFEALNPHSKAAPIVRVILLVAIVFLLVGLLPGSYLHRRIQGASRTEAVRRSRLLSVVAVVFPVLGAVAYALGAYSQYSEPSFIDNSYLSGLDRS